MNKSLIYASVAHARECLNLTPIDVTGIRECLDIINTEMGKNVFGSVAQARAHLESTPIDVVELKKCLHNIESEMGTRHPFKIEAA